MKWIVVFRRTHALKNTTPYPFEINLAQESGFEKDIEATIMPGDYFSISPSMYSFEIRFWRSGDGIGISEFTHALRL